MRIRCAAVDGRRPKRERRSTRRRARRDDRTVQRVDRRRGERKGRAGRPRCLDACIRRHRNRRCGGVRHRHDERVRPDVRVMIGRGAGDGRRSDRERRAARGTAGDRNDAIDEIRRRRRIAERCTGRRRGLHRRVRRHRHRRSDRVGHVDRKRSRGRVVVRVLRRTRNGRCARSERRAARRRARDRDAAVNDVIRRRRIGRHCACGLRGLERLIPGQRERRRRGVLDGDRCRRRCAGLMAVGDSEPDVVHADRQNHRQAGRRAELGSALGPAVRQRVVGIGIRGSACDRDRRASCRRRFDGLRRARARARRVIQRRDHAERGQ